MGIFLSKTDERKNERPADLLFRQVNPIYSPNSCNYHTNTGEKSECAHVLASSHRKWQNANYPAQTHQEKCITIPVPDFKTLKNEEKERKEGHVMVNCKVAAVAAPERRWIKHYSSSHLILLVGEGDFSFSACLAAAFGRASNMVATSLDSEAFLLMNYRNALSNIVEVISRKCKVMHEIDATQMANHAFLGSIKFDRIIFNFPFAGFFKNLSRDSQLQLHRRLVSLFLKNAKEMISENGEIHISHKTNGFHKEWDLESIASSHRLRLIDAVVFYIDDYPGYNTKYGFGGDNNFNCNPSKTYKFGLKW